MMQFLAFLASLDYEVGIILPMLSLYQKVEHCMVLG